MRARNTSLVALAAGLCLSSACASTDVGISETLDDSAITISVKNRLLDDPQVRGLRIDVDTRDGVVFLTGAVGSDEERRKAIRLAWGTKGVRDVQANLTLQRG